MANETTDTAAATGRVTRSAAQAAASASSAAPASSATHDTAAYLTRDMLPERLSRFADYVTAAWQDRRTIINEHSTSLDIDNKLAYLYNYYVEHDKTHEMLRRTFCEDCEHWTLPIWEKASSRPRQEMRDLLEVNGIYVGKGSGSKIAGNLHRVVTRYMCDDDDDESEKPKESKAKMHFNEQGDLVTDDGDERSTSFQQELDRQQAELANMTAKLEAAQEITAKLEAAHLDNSKSRQGSPPKTPDPGKWMPDSFDAIGITDNEIRRCLADFNKMYKDSDKYSGERYHFIESGQVQD
ncbi:hypothetical protein E4U09_006772 [Claviceps aff. purpurea]|uniref:Uncharacterized protein n=1 Tax=Claviceps aff. purpurea TaxID=1967640 RepID=A0A9P7U366_9HYPO|nr:hypothetical protein E4U09_006771 [Claviceps aff. purpurea]KAG6286344.1 hypothetical protein E4U09_006772 [Claviceps aff. purpurea]